MVPAKIAVFVAAWYPLARIVLFGLTDRLGANPIEFITRSTGLWTLVFLCITLAVTPLRRLTGVSALVRFRRMLGLYAFFYATLHFTTYLWFDKWFDVAAILKDIGKRPFIMVGFAAFVLLIVLAVTSPRAMVEEAGTPLADAAPRDLRHRRARDPAFLVDEVGQARSAAAEDLRRDHGGAAWGGVCLRGCASVGRCRPGRGEGDPAPLAALGASQRKRRCRGGIAFFSAFWRVRRLPRAVKPAGWFRRRTTA